MTAHDEHEALWDLDKDEVERKLDALLDALRDEGRQDTVQWAVEVICDTFTLPLYTGSEEATGDIDSIGQRWVSSLLWHGQRCAEGRPAMLKLALGHVREVLSVLEEWSEGEGGSGA